MGTPYYSDLPRATRIRLAGNAVAPLQARLAIRLAARELMGADRDDMHTA